MSGYHNDHYGGTTPPYGNGRGNGNANGNAYYGNNNYGYGEEMVEFDVLNHGHGHGNDAVYNNVNMNNNNGYDNDKPKPVRPGLQPAEDFMSPAGSPMGTPMGGQSGWPLPTRRGHDRSHVDSFASVSSTPAGSRSTTPAFVCPALGC